MVVRSCVRRGKGSQEGTCASRESAVGRKDTFFSGGRERRQRKFNSLCFTLSNSEKTNHHGGFLVSGAANERDLSFRMGSEEQKESQSRFSFFVPLGRRLCRSSQPCRDACSPEVRLLSEAGPALPAPGLAAERRTRELPPGAAYAVTGRLEPLAVARTRIRCDWLFAPESAAAPRFDPAPAVEFRDTTNRQDWRVCKSAPAGIASSAYCPGLLLQPRRPTLGDRPPGLRPPLLNRRPATQFGGSVSSSETSSSRMSRTRS